MNSKWSSFSHTIAWSWRRAARAGTKQGQSRGCGERQRKKKALWVVALMVHGARDIQLDVASIGPSPSSPE